MKIALPLIDDKKLFITFRLEPGCLGPQGSSHISAFCQFAQPELSPFNAEVIVWNIVPRNDKSLAEIEYAITGKKISESQAKKYLSLFDKNLDAIEGDLGDKIEVLIGQYMQSAADS